MGSWFRDVSLGQAVMGAERGIGVSRWFVQRVEEKIEAGPKAGLELE